MNILTQEAKKKQAAVKFAIRKGKSEASRRYGVSLSSIKRWCKRYDGTWQSLVEKSHRPHSNPNRHTKKEERQIKNSFKKKFARYGWDGVYQDLLRKGYTRSFSGMVYAAKRLGLKENKKPKKKSREQRRYPELKTPGEKVQIDVKEVPYNCLRGEVLRDGKHLYQWTAIDECTRNRFVYAFEEHTPENSVKFLKMLVTVFPFKIQTIQTDNGTEFTYKYISDTEICPFDKELKKLHINHKLIPPRTPWHNGKVERSHRNDQRYFYDWETFRNVDELNQKLEKHLEWSNNKPMRTLGYKSPVQLLAEKMSA
ncbi:MULTISPECIES: DDE-type integrase/transposase/recombinase [unclassified Ruminococcus]|uniref:DDE-type integrase/transposase/recombinase n=1 Tax=unclassified Ruminococcus TaxID=2608920 RepID=UPI00210C5C05|nr:MULTISPECIES: DDE-type integrase/transposase/recombinase [unclassified Ruminococcus]MCQ4023397.1 DDE-type integrase/transposase/recombinase [Ruminococcus sp. zg-924]MCQ4115771.1 DDE-type integrase/transposase/recombinase [Ruminococcus sp. zg-921]